MRKIQPGEFQKQIPMPGDVMASLWADDGRLSIPKVFIERLHDFDLGITVFFISLEIKQAIKEEEHIEGYIDLDLKSISRKYYYDIDKLTECYQYLVENGLVIEAYSDVTFSTLCKLDLKELYRILDRTNQ